MSSPTDIARPRGRSAPADGPEPAEPPIVPPELWYDRSSITADAMVMIADQSPEDFERYAPETRYCDYIDGVVYMPSPATDRHQEIIGFGFDLLNGYRLERGTGRVLLGPAVLRINENRKPEPDIFVRPGPDAGPDAPPAVLVVEVLSKSTKSHDLGLKLQVYRDARIPEIWLIDDLSRERAFHIERLVGDEYSRETVREGRIECSALPGFWIEAEWFWADPQPNPRECLRRILGEGEAPRPA